jgi:hypothetical protein
MQVFVPGQRGFHTLSCKGSDVTNWSFFALRD